MSTQGQRNRRRRDWLYSDDDRPPPDPESLTRVLRASEGVWIASSLDTPRPSSQRNIPTISIGDSPRGSNPLAGGSSSAQPSTGLLPPIDLPSHIPELRFSPDVLDRYDRYVQNPVSTHPSFIQLLNLVAVVRPKAVFKPWTATAGVVTTTPFTIVEGLASAWVPPVVSNHLVDNEAPIPFAATAGQSIKIIPFQTVATIPCIPLALSNTILPVQVIPLPSARTAAAPVSDAVLLLQKYQGSNTNLPNVVILKIENFLAEDTIAAAAGVVSIVDVVSQIEAVISGVSAPEILIVEIVTVEFVTTEACLV
ncbi:hypothetical protein VTJ04DRAFT_2246 [Mycothermus thermophilus]|uniref:uncharacterized protein n=1 Tax=Humicola insolens TaxID=85995 RepID=UPI0037430084